MGTPDKTESKKFWSKFLNPENKPILNYSEVKSLIQMLASDKSQDILLSNDTLINNIEKLFKQRGYINNNDFLIELFIDQF